MSKNVETLENALEACQTAAIGGFGAVVIDTVTAFPTNEDLRCGINDKVPPGNLQARVMSKCLPILTGLLHVTGCTLILVNQMRNKPGTIYGNPECPAGGKAVGYFAALRLETRRVEMMRSGDIVTSQKVAVNVVKYKQGSTGQEGYPYTEVWGRGDGMSVTVTKHPDGSITATIDHHPLPEARFKAVYALETAGVYAGMVIAVAALCGVLRLFLRS